MGRRSKKSGQSLLADNAKTAKQYTEDSLTDDGHVVVTSSYSLLDGIAKAGEGKAGIYPTILSTVSDNEQCTFEEGQIGDKASRPVVLARTKAEATSHLINRALRIPRLTHGPVFRIVD